MNVKVTSDASNWKVIFCHDLAKFVARNHSRYRNNIRRRTLINIENHFNGRPNYEVLGDYVKRPFRELCPHRNSPDYSLRRAISKVLYDVSGGEYPLDGRAVSQKFHVRTPVDRKALAKKNEEIKAAWELRDQTMKELRQLRSQVTTLGQRNDELKRKLKAATAMVSYYRKRYAESKTEPVVMQPIVDALASPEAPKKGLWARMFGG